ncbi:bifunctional riboflavin kinase/FAD synthetase, partial [Thermodesulfobacteriota bacterium]
IFCLPFTHEFASISAEAFVKDLLVGKIGIKELVVGYDYTFGSDRKGDINLLRSMGEELGFRVHMVDPVYLSGTLVSSTSIRNLIREGNLIEGKRLLGRDYHIAGTVAKGADRGGKVLGFPTANIIPDDELIPRQGVYAVSVKLGEETYQGVCNIGYNPTFGDNSLSIETHILDFSGDIVGEQINIIFIQHMRDEKTFNGIQELADQIAKDINQAKELFNLYGHSQNT